MIVKMKLNEFRKIVRKILRETLHEKEEKWIQKAKPEKGALHKALGIPEDKKIPTSLLRKKKAELQKKAEGEKKLSTADSKLLKQISLALTFKKINK